ncbi:MAG: MATE family efflux transporter [Crocinitomicaceae bacterium]
MLDFKYLSILKVAIPLMTSSFIQAIVTITDTAFLSRYNTLSFDASGNAGMLYMTLFIAMMGMSDGSQILMARRIGQNKLKRIGLIFGTSLITLFGLAFIFYCALHWVIPSFLHSVSKNQTIASLQVDFLSIRSYSLFLGVFLLVTQAFLYATGKTTIVVINALLVALSNVILDYGLIFGQIGLPELGIKGAALASTIAEGIGAFFLTAYLFFGKQRKKYHLFSHFVFRLKSVIELIKVGTPMLLQGVFSLGTWTVFFIWIEQMGEFELTVSQNIRAIYFLIFIPIWGFATTTKTYISQYIGAKRFDDIKIIQRRIQLLTISVLALIVLACVIFPYQIIGAINPEQEYLVKTKDILLFIAGSTFIFGFSSVYVQTISGSGNTFFTFLVEGVCVGIYIIVAYLLVKVFKLDIFWVWSVEYIYFISMGLISIGYLKFFNWKEKVI